MTCKQARQLLAAYRREDLSPGENAELQAHLADCAQCQAHAAQFQRMGVALQALPKLAAPPDFYARVMAAVQAEMPRAAERVPVAAPKKQENVIIPGLTDVSYLPSVRRAVQQRRARVTPMRRQMSSAGVFALRYGAALAALFLIFAGGLSVALFELLNSGPHGTPYTPLPPPPETSFYTPNSAYPLVTDATASPNGIYIIYTAHTASGNWMLEELNRQTQEVTDLLPAPVAGPLTLEGWAQSWVLWMRGDSSTGASWQLDATELSPALPGAASTLRLLQGNEAGTADSVTALHGVATLGSTVLLAEELANGHGQLVSLDLARQAEPTRSVIFTAPEPDHLITEPMATIDPTTGVLTDYWVDQWQDLDGTPHGNIWRLTLGGIPQPVTTNDVSFAPKMVAGKLFWLEEALSPDGVASDQPGSTPTAATGTATPGTGAGVNTNVSGIIWSENADGRPDLDVGTKNRDCRDRYPCCRTPGRRDVCGLAR